MKHDFQKTESTGFITGTLVHSDQGLVPIEQIKVGNRVLSKHESDEGTLEYKRVTKTFKSAEKQKVMGVWYRVGTNPLERLLICTYEHPFWIEGRGWVAANEIGADYKHGYLPSIILSDGQMVRWSDDPGLHQRQLCKLMPPA